METDKRDRMKKVELRRLEDEEKENQRFLADVMRLEIREPGSKEAEETAKMKLSLDEQDWLMEALRMEERASNPTPAPPPNLQAKMGRSHGESWRRGGIIFMRHFIGFSHLLYICLFQ
jgi:hypothetical protein